MSMASDIARYLAANGFGTIAAPAPTIMSGAMSNTPDNVISAYDQPGGGPPVLVMGGTDHEMRNLQIIVRNTSPSGGEAIAMNVWKLLHRKVDTVINGTLYKSILAKHSPFSLGLDENNRTKWSCNYEVRKDVSA